MYIKHVLNLTNSSYSPTCPLPSNSAPSHDQSNKHHSSAQPSECLPASPTHPANLPSPNRHKRPSPRTSSRLSPTRYANATPPLKTKQKQTLTTITTTGPPHLLRPRPEHPKDARPQRRRRLDCAQEDPGDSARVSGARRPQRHPQHWRQEIDESGRWPIDDCYEPLWTSAAQRSALEQRVV